MIINTKGIEVSESNYLSKEGRYLFKIEKFEEDGYTTAGDAKFNLHFKGVEVGTKEPLYTHREMFSVGEKALWKIKTVEIALKAPEIYEINNFVGRYIIANIVKDTYVKSDGSEGFSFKAKSWEYSTLNDKMPPIPTATQNENASIGKHDDVTIDIDEDDLPFS